MAHRPLHPTPPCNPPARTAVVRHAVGSSPVSSSQPATQAQELPARMRRWVSRRPGYSFRDCAVLEPTDLQPPGPGEVVVQMSWAGINGGCETFRARREFAFQCPSQETVVPLGAEGAGVVVAVGPGVRKIKVGQPVAVNASAAFSEYCVAKERMVTAVPRSAGDPGPEAAALALSGMTAIAALEGTAKISSGQTVVVTAAAGGTGHLAVQLALLAGCRVAAVCGGASKVDALQRLPHHTGSLVVIDHKTQDVEAAVRAAAPGGVDVVYEGVGGSIRQQLLRCLAPGGQFLQVGYISEYPHACGYPANTPPDHLHPHPAASSTDNPTHSQTHTHTGSCSQADSWHDAVLRLPAADQLFWSGIRVSGLPGGRVITGQVWPTDARTLLTCKARLWDLYYNKGLLDVWVDTSHGLKGIEAVPDAVDHMLKGGHLGKVVLQL